MHYTLTETELAELEADPSLIPERLKQWRQFIEVRKTQAAKTRQHIDQVAAASGEEW